MCLENILFPLAIEGVCYTKKHNWKNKRKIQEKTVCIVCNYHYIICIEEKYYFLYLESIILTTKNTKLQPSIICILWRYDLFLTWKLSITIYTTKIHKCKKKKLKKKQ